ncbi:MAG: hypothetical protein AAFP76_13590 [Bacteroidota bacterium]
MFRISLVILLTLFVVSCSGDDDTNDPVQETCNIPTGLNVSIGVTAEGWRIINWDNATPREWEVEYGAEGFNLGSGTVLQLTNNGFILENVPFGVPQDVYVRKVCGTAFSEYAGPVVAEAIMPPNP